MDVASIVEVKSVLRFNRFRLNISFPEVQVARQYWITWLCPVKDATITSTTKQKDAIDPVSGDTVPLYHPRKQRWNNHFAWNDDFTLIIGLTPTGRSTVEALQLNREGVVNLRRVLYAIGEHPPIEANQ